ncbi:MAG: hypothetical protein MUC95_03095 [Spirochaetes bacterium]|nr:hypothetical protein [Spirochaetota bacterium]
MAQDPIQTLKLEISKQTQLLPYERISFHKILGILKTDNGMKVLLRELKNQPLVRESAILSLSEFEYEEVKAAFISLLNQNLNPSEKIHILDYLEKFGTNEDIPEIIKLIDQNRDKPETYRVLSKAFNVLRAVSTGSSDAVKYLTSTALNAELNLELRSYAIVALAFSHSVVSTERGEVKSFFEEILRNGREELVYAVYKALYILSSTLAEKAENNKSDDDRIFTYSPEQEDKATLDIRVLLGKMTSQFDSYSNRVKVAYINAMISCNHREFLIYTMRALTSDNPELIDMTLDLLHSEASRLRDPDKLFRNLIALSVDSPRGSNTIVSIFENFFLNMKEIRRNMILRDKLYNYIAVTLESYFETYRKDFMITEVAEKNYPENFQRVRHFILERFNPAYKKKVTTYLRQADTKLLPALAAELSEKIPNIAEHEKEQFNFLLEILFDKDGKSREISASRLDDINFDKKYLKDRIIRLCRIISRLKIETAASQLVIIYNYLKKYTDVEILDAVSSTLALLNYSYMLGELEVLLATADAADQEKAIQYLSLYSDQRSLNILLDYLKVNIEGDPDIIKRLLNTLQKQDIAGNASANQIFKKIIETTEDTEIKRQAILCLGKCGEEKDVIYLYDLFFVLKEAQPKEAAVQALGHIINLNPHINKLPVLKQLREYLKDSGIRVRIYSCFLLLQLGDRNALRVITDMMTIKNKNIQREIISILGILKSVEFVYFLISLLKDEYAISSDIIPAIKMLNMEDLLEIDHFIANIFKKHEFVDMETESRTPVEDKEKPVKGLSMKKVTLLNIQIINFIQFIANMSITDLTMINKDINSLIIAEIEKNEGVMSRITNGRLIAFFNEARSGSDSALNIFRNIHKYNIIRMPKDRLNISMQLITDDVEIINDEVLSLTDEKVELVKLLPVANRMLLDDETKLLVSGIFATEPVPEIGFRQCGSEIKFHELICPVNFKALADETLNRLEEEEEEKLQKEIELEADIRKQKESKRSPVTIAYAQSLDDIARTLKKDLNEISKYIQMRTTDRVLISNIEKMLTTIYQRFFVEKSKIFSDLEK